jgi:hypothetical protein
MDANRREKRDARQSEKAGWMFLVLLIVLLVFGSWVILDPAIRAPGQMDVLDGTDGYGSQMREGLAGNSG